MFTATSLPRQQNEPRRQNGQSGNPGGRPKARRPHNSAFDIIFDKSLTVTQNGTERQLAIDEALELQTYKAALGGSQMAIRKVLKMIEKRDAALAKRAPPPARKITISAHYCSDNANAAMEILDIAHRRDYSLTHIQWRGRDSGAAGYCHQEVPRG